MTKRHPFLPGNSHIPQTDRRRVPDPHFTPNGNDGRTLPHLAAGEVPHLRRSVLREEARVWRPAATAPRFFCTTSRPTAASEGRTRKNAACCLPAL